MKKYILMLVLFSGVSHSQWIVNDPINLLQLVRQYTQQIKDYALKLKQWKELVDQSQSLKNLIGDNGLWETTFEALSNIQSFLKEVDELVSAVQARDVYALIEHLPVDDEWKEKTVKVLEQTHGYIPDHLFDRLVERVALKNPDLAVVIVRSRDRQKALINHRLNSFYYVSSRKDKVDKRLDLINDQKNQIASFGDNSQGKSAVMTNSQLLLMNQQNEEVIRALNHMIMTQNDAFFEKQSIHELEYKILLRDADVRSAMNPENFRGFDF